MAVVLVVGSGCSSSSYSSCSGLRVVVVVVVG